MAAQPRRADDDRAVRVAEVMLAPIETSLSMKTRRFSNIFSKIRTEPSDCVASATAIEVRSAGNAGHGPSSTLDW